MNRNQWILGLALAVLAALVWVDRNDLDGRPSAAHAQAIAPPDSSLPPIFQRDNVVTFGPQGPELTILEVHGNWIYAAQNLRFGRSTATEDIDPRSLFWIHVPSINQSWQLVERDGRR